MHSGSYHRPVMREAITAFAAGKRRAVDCTVGGGGHAELLLALGADVLAIDRDSAAIAAAQERLDGAATFLRTAFDSTMALEAISGFAPDFVLLDLGVSSYQIDQHTRGFSFEPGVPLDMRMDQGSGLVASDLLNSYDEAELTRVFRDFGDERRARSLAREIVRRRRNRSFGTSDDLVGAIRATLGPRSGPSDFARLFQAVRIEVNGELDALNNALPGLLASLEPSGVLTVLSYHSGEDRIVKHSFAQWAKSCICPPQAPQCICRGVSLGKVLTKKPLVPDAAEIGSNPRARSAKLRAFEKADAR
ncbi:MAG: 16S rRNA (cytosine(1402)-N(4))-methyltransferase RsmH [Gemmatimonadales bacterium]